MDFKGLQYLYARQTQFPKPYLANPNYGEYVDMINRQMKTGPFYTFNQGSKMCIMYNYIQPVAPYVAPPCDVSKRFQFWLTPQ